MTDTEPQDRDTRHCTATTRAGIPCTAYAMKGMDKCAGHSGVLAKTAKQASDKSVQMRRDRARKREEAVEASKLTLTQWFARVAGEHAEELARAAVRRALDGDSRAMTIVLERVEGKVADHLITTEGDPFLMTEAEIAKWIATEDDTVADSALPDHP